MGNKQKNEKQCIDVVLDIKSIGRTEKVKVFVNYMNKGTNDFFFILKMRHSALIHKHRK